MGILTITGIVLGAVGSAAMGVGGVLLSIDCAKKSTIKYLDNWKEETTKKINEKMKD